MRHKKKKIILPIFELTEVCDGTCSNAKKINLIENGESFEYHVKRIENEFEYSSFGERHCYNRFPIVMNGNGTIWDEANLYILDSMEDELFVENIENYHKIADDLSNFGEFLMEFSIDPYTFPKNRTSRPTYRYCKYLNELVNEKKISWGLAKRRMASVVNWYQHLNIEYSLQFESPPWKARRGGIPIETIGGIKIISVEYTDLVIKKHRKERGDKVINDCIVDGEILKPLIFEEQKKILQILEEEDNYEMHLIFLIALFTGARIQTICTMRAHWFYETTDIPLRMAAGPNTGCDTKNDKSGILKIPAWVADKISVYVKSKNWSLRNEKFKKNNSHDIYGPFVFLTIKGNVFYETKLERRTYAENNKKIHLVRGDAIRVFIYEKVLPKMRAEFGNDFHFKFHNLRATFGMNYVEFLTSEGQPKLTHREVLEKVAEALWHDSLVTAERYVGYKTIRNSRLVAQTNFELHLETLAMNGMRKEYVN